MYCNYPHCPLILFLEGKKETFDNSYTLERRNSDSNITFAESNLNNIDNLKWIKKFKKKKKKH